MFGSLTESQNIFHGPLIDNGPTVYGLKGIVSKEELKKILEHLVNAYKNRYYKSEYGWMAAIWIFAKWTSLTQTRDDIFISK